MFRLAITPRPARQEEWDEPRAAASGRAARWVSGYHSAEEHFFEDVLGRLAELEREYSRSPHPPPAD